MRTSQVRGDLPGLGGEELLGNTALGAWHDGCFSGLPR